MKVEVIGPNRKLAPGQIWQRNKGMYKEGVYLCVRLNDNLALIDTADFDSFWNRYMTPDSSMEGFSYIGDLKVTP